MAEFAYPLVYAALFNLINTTLTDVRVVDGYDISNDPGDVLVLGVPDINDTTAVNAGTFDQSMNAFGRSTGRAEEGTINGALLAWVGDTSDTSAALARAKAFGYLTELATALRLSPDLGVTDLQDLVTQFSSGAPLEDKEGGSICVISFTVAYKAFL